MTEHRADNTSNVTWIAPHLSDLDAALIGALDHGINSDLYGYKCSQYTDCDLIVALLKRASSIMRDGIGLWADTERDILLTRISQLRDVADDCTVADKAS
jgi:hypothetical protein